MELIRNKKEKIDLFSKNADDWYKKTSEYFANRADFIKLNDDGLFFEIEKPSIQKVMYYNDENDAPSTSFENFKNYNYLYTFFSKFDNWLKKVEEGKRCGCWIGNLLMMPIICYNTQYGQPNRCSIILYQDYDYKAKENQAQREMTAEELEQFIDIMQELKNNYLKRLETYYKKYQKVICTSGYWANR